MNHMMIIGASWSLLAAFFAGVAGSVHCLAMCGGLSGALGLRARRLGASAGQAVGHAVTYQMGRLASYSLAGALAGSLMAMAEALIDVDALARVVRSLAGLVLIGVAIGVLFKWRPLARLEQLGGRLWRHLAPLSRDIPTHRLRGSFLIGMLWGWLPCGMVYSMLLVAALAGSPARGAATMLCFGLGTLPAVLAAGLASAQVLRLGAGRRLHLVVGSLLLVFGLLTLIAPFSLHTHVHG